MPHAYDYTMILLFVRACDVSCALPIPIICSDDMVAMISSSMLHLRNTSLHVMIDMIAYVASPMIHTCLFHAADGIHFLTMQMISVEYCIIAPYGASLMLDELPCIECNNAFSLANEISPIAFSHILEILT